MTYDYSQVKRIKPTPEEQDAEDNFNCLVCQVNSGEPCKSILWPANGLVKDYRMKNGYGNYVHEMRLEARNNART